LKRKDKSGVVADLHQQMNRAKVTILTRFTGLNVEKMTHLRRELRQSAVDYRIVKNTLFRLAIQNTDKEPLSSHLEGPVGVAWSESDPVAPARILAKFAKDYPELKFMVAASEGKIWGPADIQGWVSLPSLGELRGKILGLIQAPASSLARLKSSLGTQLVRVLRARSEQN
jgi:large subunit ribosomal protein L10